MERLGKIRTYRQDIDAWIGCRDSIRRPPQGRAGDVDRYIGYRRRQVVQEPARLDAAATSVLDKRHPWPNLRCDLGGMLTHDRQLGASRIVLLELTDSLEQLGTSLVIEILARQPLLFLAETLLNIRQKVRCGWLEVQYRHG